MPLKKEIKKNTGTGKYQIIGTTCRQHDSPSKILERLSQELYKKNNLKWNQLVALGTQARWEKYRKCTAFVLTYNLKITVKEFYNLSGSWKIFKEKGLEKNNKIIDIQKNVIGKLKNSETKFLFI